MTMIEVDTVKGPGRRIKFTPERVEQIKTLIERGVSREQIAAMIDVTVGSLQVTCSKLGISLRKPKNNHMHLKPDENGNGPTPPAKPVPEPTTGNDNGKRSAYLTLTIHLHGRTRSYPLPLPPEVMNDLVLQAQFRGLSVGEMIAELIKDGLKK